MSEPPAPSEGSESLAPELSGLLSDVGLNRAAIDPIDFLGQLSRLAADAIAMSDAATMDQLMLALSDALPRLEPSLRGRVEGLLGVVRAASLTVQSNLDLEPGALSARMLEALRSEPDLSNRELSLRLGVDESQISRAGRALLEKGWLLRTKRGRTNRWVVTPIGRAGAEVQSAKDTGALAVERFTELLESANPAARLAAAADLASFGVAMRRSTLTRGSIVRGALARVAADTEQSIRSLLRSTSDALQLAVLRVAAEWASDAVVPAVVDMIFDERSNDAVRAAAMDALRKLGGLDASAALARLLTATDQAAGPSFSERLRLDAISILGELVTGGAGDPADPSAEATASVRWNTSEPQRAGLVLGRVSLALAGVAMGGGGISRHESRSAKPLIAQIDAWAAANNLAVDIGAAMEEQLAKEQGGVLHAAIFGANAGTLELAPPSKKASDNAPIAVGVPTSLRSILGQRSRVRLQLLGRTLRVELLNVDNPKLVVVVAARGRGVATQAQLRPVPEDGTVRRADISWSTATFPSSLYLFVSGGETLLSD